MKGVLLVVTFAVFCILPLRAQQRSGGDSAKPCANCKEQKNALASGAYGYAAMNNIWPPTFPVGAGITIAVQLKPEIKVFLHANGDRFELWVGTAQVPGNNVWDFLGDLADSCRLPPDPADAVKLLKIRWEVKDLQQKQFEQLHKDFMDALTSYVFTVQGRSAVFMAHKLQGGGVDASIYPIVYDNSWEHFKIDEWDLPVNGQTTSMIKWVHELKRFAEGSFHRSFS
ncbi:MAG: hypothetical protein ACYDD2_07230 [Candidatus Acidiferrales bacterium]